MKAKVTLLNIAKKSKLKLCKDVDILFILGGDGTVNELINGVMAHNLQLPIGILPGGTFNDFTKR